MDVVHDGRQQKFYVMHKGREYSLEYNVIEPGIWEFHCPYLPDTGKDLAILDYITEYAIFFLKRNKIILQNAGNCPYFADFAARKKDILPVQNSGL